MRESHTCSVAAAAHFYGPTQANGTIIGPVMSKQAGPRRIDPESFQPVVWKLHGAVIGDDLEFLVCQRRIFRGATVMCGPKKEGVTSEYFGHPVAIQLNPTLEVHHGLRLTEKVWEAHRTEAHEISERCAKIALAEAYHGIKASLDLVTWKAHFSSQGPVLRQHKNGVRMRNLLIAIFWDHWKNDGIKMEVRLLMMQQFGFPCTERQIKRFGTDHGL